MVAVLLTLLVLLQFPADLEVWHMLRRKTKSGEQFR